MTTKTQRSAPAALLRFPDLAQEASAMTLDQLAKRLNPASYARLDGKPRADSEELVAFEAALVKLIDGETRTVTVRRVFYLAVSAKIVNKTEREAERVQEAVLRLRRDGFVGYDRISDETRDVVEVNLFDDEADFVAQAARWWFRTDPWKDADEIALVLSEKRGMPPILREVTDDYSVPLYPMAGYTSETALYEAGERIQASGKRAVVFQVGDYDNSGIDMARDAEERLVRLAMAPVKFVRIAVLEEHITRYSLPTRPQKLDKRIVKVEQAAVEIDAMRPDDVQALLRAALRRYMPDSPLAGHRADDDKRRAKLLAHMSTYRPWRRTP